MSFFKLAEDFFDFSIIDGVMWAAMGEKCTRECFRYMHKLVNKRFNFFSFALFIEEFGIHLNDVMRMKTSDVLKQARHTPDSGDSPRFRIEATDTVDILSFYVSKS